MTRRAAWTVTAIALLVIAAAVAWRWLTPQRAEVIEFAMREPRDTPTALAVGPDDSVWFTLDFVNAVGRIRNGTLERFTEPGTNLEPIGLAVGNDGAAWYTDAAARQIQRVAPDGTVTSLTLETPVAKLGKIAVAPDGAVWFAEASMYSITRLKDGKLERKVIDSVRGGPYGVAAAPDGSIWATLQSANQLLHIAADGQMRSYDIPTRSSSPSDIAIDSQGAVWFIEFRSNRLGRFKDGRWDEYAVEGGPTAGLTGLAVAPDGAVWFGMLRSGALGRWRNGEIETFVLPRKGARPYSVAADSKGNIWYTDIAGYVGQIPVRSARR
jgi:virginiamycin B lyase